MPVLIHAVHEKTRIDSGFRYGCLASKRKDFYFVGDRFYFPDGRYEIRMRVVSDRLSKECRYDHSLMDNACGGCAKRGQGEAYSQRIRELSA